MSASLSMPRTERVRLEKGGTPAQAKFVHSKFPYPAFVGGLGSGKTYALCMRALYLLIRDRVDIAYYMPTYDLVRLVGFVTMQQLIIDAGMDYRPSQVPLQLFVKGYGTILFRTMEEPDKLVGYSVGHSLVDELDTLPPKKAEIIWRRVLARNRVMIPSGSINTIGVGTTPEGWRFVYERWGRDVRGAEEQGYKLYRGRTLDNKRLPPEYIRSLEDQYPRHLLEAYLNGEFVNMETGIVHREWFRVSTIMPSYLAMGVDLATSIKTSADASAIVVAGLDDGRVHVVHAVAIRGTFNDVQELIKAQAAAWKPKMIHIEAVQYQLAAVQELMRTTTLPVVPVRPDKDKAARLLPLAARYEQGMVCHAPANSGNAIRALEDELVAFPNGGHDDLVDALVYAWQGLPTVGHSLPVVGAPRVIRHG